MGDVVEPDRPHEVAAGPREQTGTDQQPRGPVFAPSQDPRNAHADRDELDRGVHAIVGEAIQ